MSEVYMEDSQAAQFLENTVVAFSEVLATVANNITARGSCNVSEMRNRKSYKTTESIFGKQT